MTKVEIVNGENTTLSLALAPVSVEPVYQKNGIGSALIKQAHKLALELKFMSIVLVGHADYYPRFGYQPTNNFNISAPFDVPNENFMAVELVNGSLENVDGIVAYAPEFGI